MMRFVAVMLLLAGCEPSEELEEQFECAEVDSVDFCDDFNGGSSAEWSPEGGTWMVRSGRFLGSGPRDVEGAECAASRMTAAYRSGVTATDLEMHAEMISEARLDKVIVLRATDASNRIELNFRADPLNDLVVQELVDCELVFHTQENEIPVPHGEGEPIDSVVTLDGNHLVVEVNGEMVLDRDFEFVNQDGELGVAVIDNAVTSFDSIWMRRIE